MRALIPAMLLILAAGQSGCENSMPARRTESGPPPSSQVREGDRARLPAEQFPQAARLYAIKCARCHKLYSPTDYSGPGWESWLAKMSKKAHLKADQRDLLIRYRRSLEP